MGQKVHPGGLRVGVIHDWKSNWMVGKKEFAGALIEDIKIREHILKKLAHAGLSDILIRKDKQRITIDIYTARPGIVIGKSGVEVDALRREVHAMTQKNVHININEIKRPELDAKLVAQSIAEQLQNRVSFRRAMKRSLASAIRSGAAGVKVQCSGRLGGSEMSRSEQYSEGRVPLHTIRADIDYGFVEARTPTGRIGVKVWINKGEIMPEGYGGIPGGGKETRLGDQDAARRRGGSSEGLGASREGGRGRQQDREGLGPVRRGRPGQRRGPGAPRAGGGPGGGGGRSGAPGGGQRGGAPGGGGQRPAGGGAGGGGDRLSAAGGGRGRPRSQGGRPGDGDRARGQDNVERPRTDESARSAEGREQPTIEPQVEETPKPVAEAPDTTTPKTMHEDPSKLDSSGTKDEHGGSGGEGS
jgi:small subunit ribosomal protein S3